MIWLNIVIILFVVALALAGECMCSAGESDSVDNGRVIYVCPTGKTGAPGTAEAPLSSVQEALDQAHAGDTVRLRPGVYRERVSFRHSGVYLRPVTLEGEPGAILDGSEPITLQWTARPDIGPDVYVAHTPFWPTSGYFTGSYRPHRPDMPFFPFTVIADGKIITSLYEPNVEDRVPPDHPEWHWRSIFKDGLVPYHSSPDSEWDGVKALVMYRREQQELVIRFQDGRDPNNTPINISPTYPVVTIQGVNRCVVRGLTIRNATRGVYIENSLGSVVEECVIGPAEFGVMLQTGADRCTIRFNEIFMEPFAGADPKRRGSWANWEAMKTGGFSDRYGIVMLATAGGHQIHDNHIRDHWDGIGDWIPSGETGGDHNLNIHHNRLSYCFDDALESNGEEVNNKWHHNIVENSRVAIRVKAPLLGPMYVYRNIFINNGEDIRFFGEVPQLPAKVYVYHNTTTADAAIYSLKIGGVGTPNYHVYNNLFWCARAQAVSSITQPNWTADYNVYVNNERWGADWWSAAKKEVIDRVQDMNSRWVDSGEPGFVDFDNNDLSLTPDSPARERGIDLSELFEQPLPDCPPGYFQGTAPDAGALQFGEPMLRVPRRPEEVDCPPAGSWPEQN